MALSLLFVYFGLTRRPEITNPDVCYSNICIEVVIVGNVEVHDRWMVCVYVVNIWVMLSDQDSMGGGTLITSDKYTLRI